MYTATITSGALRLRESRIIATQLLDDSGPVQWREMLYARNALQLRSSESIRIVSNLIRARLSELSNGLLQMVATSDREQATQVLLAAAVKHSRLLGDFMDITLREQFATFEPQVNKHIWENYLEGCHGRDPQMPQWSESTRNRLRSTVFSVLAEAGYLESTRNLTLNRVFIDPIVKQQLEDAGDHYALRCLEVST